MFKNIFIKLIRLYLNKINKSSRVRDFLTWPIASRALGSKYNNITILKNGLKMKTDLGDILGRFVIFYGSNVKYFWEPQSSKLMELLIKDAKQAVIAGSHIGYMALMGRQAMRRQGAVLHSFEPVSYLYNIARKNFDLNSDLGEMIINKKALSNQIGEVSMSIDSLRSTIIEESSNNKSEKVKTITLDSYIEEKNIQQLDFILLDVEGFEPLVFAGMKNILSQKSPQDIIFEYSQKVKGNFDDIDNYTEQLKPYGYNFYIIKDNYKLENIKKDWGLVELFKLENNLEKFKKTSYFNILATKRKIEDLENLGIKIYE